MPLQPIENNDTYSGPLHEVWATSTSGGGTALTTAAAIIPIPNGVNVVSLATRNYTTAVVVKFHLNPYLVVLLTTDNLAAVITDLSSAAQDDSTGTTLTLSSLGAFAAGDFIMLGAYVPFRGFTVDVQSTNSTSSVMTVKYWNGSSWADISASDGTASGGATLAQDGSVTWTVPSAWTRVPLATTTTPTPTGKDTSFQEVYYWVRVEVSVALDSSVTLNSIVSLNRDTSKYAELLPGGIFETKINKGPGGVASVEALTDAGTANLIVNVSARPDKPGIGL